MILTSKDLPVGRLGEEAKAESPSPPPNVGKPKKEDDDMTIVVRHPAAPKDGESSSSFYKPDGTVLQLSLVNGVARVNLESAAERESTVELLLRAGFVIEKDVEEPPKPVKKGHDSEEEIVLMHPDNSEGNVIDAEIEVKIGSRRKAEKVKIERGMVYTKDLRVVAELEKLGYIVQNPHALERAKE